MGGSRASLGASASCGGGDPALEPGAPGQAPAGAAQGQPRDDRRQEEPLVGSQAEPADRYNGLFLRLWTVLTSL